jgi:hypothetical protein
MAAEVVRGLADAVSGHPKPLLLLGHVDALVDAIVDAAEGLQDPSVRATLAVLNLLGTQFVTYCPATSRRTVSFVRKALATHPGHAGILQAAAHALARGPCRVVDYQPCVRTPLDCCPKDVEEVVRVTSGAHWGQLLVFLSFCPASALSAPGVLDPILARVQEAFGADAWATCVAFYKAGRWADFMHDLTKVDALHPCLPPPPADVIGLLKLVTTVRDLSDSPQTWLPGLLKRLGLDPHNPSHNHYQHPHAARVAKWVQRACDSHTAQLQ